ncbi:hypothetical protein KFK14_01800 [Sphingobium phenoxybenzoativorans]|uniref:Uncharacterized protein n=1 Tax=Sphingobium phenoxybenzoativorans TaxID=1592790 RepID=A0A975K7L8_9SPHN|nr:hypothetical protein [Sphingobium phenoxybenzoativorans]QUT06245.1 hypothetical protein KFK14_01800 [Sphingobium phenoxybenzoativorans]
MIRPDTAAQIARLLTEGGDARITLNPETGLNRYLASPRPREMTTYASSTANDISPEAFAHLGERLDALAPRGEIDGAGYEVALDALRDRIRSAYGIGADCAIAFAPSGTDLEYVALAAVAGKAANGIHNLLLGADEIGSGCAHSAGGLHFAKETALDVATEPGTPVAGLGPVSLSQFPVRDDHGIANDSAMIAMEMRATIARAIARGEHPLVHIVHGSKTGLILPAIDDIDALRRRFGADVSFVVDACQARITGEAIAAYLRRGIIVLLTGSKFMGGPPFSGFALIPADMTAGAAPVAEGFTRIFRRAEWPEGWAGRDALPASPNLGLLMRLEAAIFELERFQALPIPRVVRVIDAFQAATGQLQSRICAQALGSRFGGAMPPQWHPIEMRTLVTLDLSCCLTRPSFDDAVAIQGGLLERGIRLGQPVRCIRMGTSGDTAQWAGTLRLGLSMPQIVRMDGLDDEALAGAFAGDMTRIGDALIAVMLGSRRSQRLSA